MRQNHIWWVMKVPNVWGNILHGINILNGVLGVRDGREGNQVLCYPHFGLAGWLARRSDLTRYF